MQSILSSFLFFYLDEEKNACVAGVIVHIAIELARHLEHIWKLKGRLTPSFPPMPNVHI